MRRPSSQANFRKKKNPPGKLNPQDFHIPGYGGFIPTEMTIKTEGGQWCPPAFLEVEAKEADTPFENLGANQPPGEGAPPRSVVFSRDGIFVEGGPAMRKAGSHLIH